MKLANRQIERDRSAVERPDVETSCLRLGCTICLALTSQEFPMAEISPLRRYMIDDMMARTLLPARQQSYIDGPAQRSDS
jgi:hypothetical protein